MSGVLRSPATAAPVSSASSAAVASFLPASSANSSTGSQAPPGGPSSKMTGPTVVTGSVRTMGTTGGVPVVTGRLVVEDTKRSPFVTQPSSMEQRSAGKKRPLSPSASSSNRHTGTSATAAAPIVASASAPPERPQHLSEKKLRRLEKNRLSARECRRRKREAAQDLEREINILEGENLRLRLQLQIGEEAEETSQQEQQRVTEEMDALLKSGAAESEVYARIEEFKEKFADYGRDRRSAIEFHLRNVERLLMPTTTTSVAMRALQGDALNATVSSSSSGSASSSLPVPATSSASIGSTSVDPNLQLDGNTSQQQSGRSVDSSGASAGAASAASVGVAGLDGAQTQSVPLEPKKMFQYLVQYLKVTPEQAGTLKDSRHVAKELDAALIQALDMLEELRGRLTQCGEDLEAEFNTVRTILTPTQAAKFLVWVANNGACMHMLNELWSKVYPKPCESLEEDDTGAGEDGESKFPAK